MYTKTPWTNGGTPAINESNLNNLEQGIYEQSLLYSESIIGATQTPTYTDGKITQIDYVVGGVTVRTDTFTYTGTTQITEVRTLNTLETVTLEHYFDANGTYNRTEVS